jgi:hypothetical protein
MSYQILRPKEFIYAPVVLGGSVIAMDSFTDTTNVLLENHVAEKGGVWTKQLGEARVDTNKLRETTGIGGTKYTQNLGRADLVMEIDYTVETNGWLGFVFRYVDNNNHWLCWADNNGLSAIYERTGGTPTLRANGAPGQAAGDNLHFKLTLLGNNMTFAITGDHTGSLNYSSAVRNTATLHGLELATGTPWTGRLDNYIATR